jgi:hypothetical protein
LQSREILAKHLATNRDTYILVLDHLIVVSEKLKKTSDADKWRAERDKLRGKKQ